MNIRRPDILAILDRLGANYPNWKVTDPLIDLWMQEFADADPKALAVACTQYMRAHTDFGPSVGHIHELIQGGPKSTELNPSDAWAEVMRWIRIGQYERREPRWSHPAIERALGVVGGIPGLQAQLSSDVPSNRARFIEAVTSYGRAAQREQQYLGADELVTALLANRTGMKQLYGADYVDPPEEPRFNAELDDIDPNWREALEYDDPALSPGVAAESESA